MSDAGRPKFEVIELIEFDPTAFGGAPTKARPSTPPAAAPVPSVVHPSAVPGVTMVLLGLLMAAAVVANGLVAQVRAQRPGRVLTFPTVARQLPTLEGHLVFDEAPGELTAAGVGTEGTDGRAMMAMRRDIVGHVFAEPEAYLDGSNGFAGRVAIFSSSPWVETDAWMTGESADAQVQGAPAAVDTLGNSVEVRFGPVDDRAFVLEAHNLDAPATLRLAEAIAIRDGVPAITDDRALDGMRPVGSIAEFHAILDLLPVAGNPWMTPNLVFVNYSGGEGDGGGTMLASIPAEGTMLPMLHLLFPEGRERPVRGTTGFLIDGATTSDLLGPGTGVAWVEGGRLIEVVGPGDEAATLALAESIRTATEEEWAEVVDVAARSRVQDGFLATSVMLDSGVTRDGETYSLLSTWLDNTQFQVCVEAATETVCSSMMGGPLPLLLPLQQGRSTFLVAVADPSTAEQAFLVLTFADSKSAAQVHPLVGYGDSLPGPTVGLQVPDGVVAAELRVDGVVVATWTLSPTG